MEGLTVEAVKLTDDAAKRIIETAYDAGARYGIGYWAEWGEDGDTIREHHDGEIAPGPWLPLTTVALEDGCARAMTAGYRIDDLDGALADVIIQFAALKELKYG